MMVYNIYEVQLTMVYVFIADGSEEIETISPIDFLRRAGVDVTIVKVGGGGTFITGSRGIAIGADIHESEICVDNLSSDSADLADLEMIVLPGGAVGVEKLYNSETVAKFINHCVLHDIKIGAICAAPSILARRGYLDGKRATAYPSFCHYLADNGAIISDSAVVTDGIFTTAWGVLASVDFALELVRVLRGDAEAAKIGR